MHLEIIYVILILWYCWCHKTRSFEANIQTLPGLVLCPVPRSSSAALSSILPSIPRTMFASSTSGDPTTAAKSSMCSFPFPLCMFVNADVTSFLVTIWENIYIQGPPYCQLSPGVRSIDITRCNTTFTVGSFTVHWWCFILQMMT